MQHPEPRHPSEATLRPRGSGGYADLLLAHAGGDAAALAAVAGLLGYRRGETSRPTAKVALPPTETGVPAPAPPQVRPGPLAPTPFWRLESRTFLEPLRLETPSSPPARDWPGLPAPPAGAELTPWNALMPCLRSGLAAPADAKAPDIDAALRRLVTGQPLDRLPRRQRRRWGERLQIIIDRSERLVPFCADQNRTAARLASLFPQHGVELAFAIEGFENLFLSRRHGAAAAYRLPEPGTLVVVLGDLGGLARNRREAEARWAKLGEQLAVAGCRPAAVTPCPRVRWPSARLRAWTLLAWEPRPPAAPAGQDQRDARADRLLRLLSPAIRIDPGLLREVRRLLGADAGTEAELWQHPHLIGRSSVAGTIDPTQANRLRQDFPQEAEALQVQVIECLRRWRGGGLSKDLWFEELLSLDPQTLAALRRKTGWLDADLAAAVDRQNELASALESVLGGPAYYRRCYGRVPATYQAPEHPVPAIVKQRLYASAFRHVANPPPPPPDFDPRLFIEPGGPDQQVELRQVGAQLFFAGPVSGPGAGSLLATVATGNRRVLVAGGVAPWAEEEGQDEFGPWVTFSVIGPDGVRVIQRLRWCPPGRFLMGSPKDEEGRWDDEGPRHEVVLADGFWLFETVCTEALWEAVTGKAPDPRRGAAFPVTNVSWDDAQDFISRLNALKPGLDLGLPSEAGWEYACRAGTDTPYSFGTTITKKQVCYESDAPVPVGSLPANRWGLHEMHGNVREWCADEWRDNYEGAPTDGSAWVDGQGAAYRVIRGGSWYYEARNVRAAYRSWCVPGTRDFSLGFRCARVQVSDQRSGAEQVAAPADPASRPGAERGRPQGPTGAATLLRVGAPAPAPLPRATSLLIRTDREELRLRRVSRADKELAWASGLGRDRYGLFAGFTLPGTEITQRLRWCPPGRFLMGSPKDEEGRWSAEGPQHEVTLAEGYWLFDTPCTQALWEAVMGENPSWFRSATRPVEQVSYEDVQMFLQKLNARVEGLNLSLPSEAQWEYACRAGTTAATWAGDLTIMGDNNAPVLDKIAWYGGNSGVGFELENGYDSSGWAGKQYEHMRAGTHPVGEKAANPWGLHDMLGNVWEWCADIWHDNYAGAPEDGSAWLATEAPGGAANRVIRGGSWYFEARFVRAASRHRSGPGFRGDSLGFRCARVQGESAVSEVERSEGPGRSKRSERSEPAATTTGPKRRRGVFDFFRSRKQT